MKVVKIMDIETLVRARFDYFDNDPLMPNADKTMITENLHRYFKKHIAAGDFSAIAVMEDDVVAAIGFMGVSEMPPSGSIPNGRLGTLFNILTYPNFRGKGYGRTLIQAFIDEAKKFDLSIIDLHATEEGSRLYEQLGFQPLHYKAMRLKLLK